MIASRLLDPSTGLALAVTTVGLILIDLSRQLRQRHPKPAAPGRVDKRLDARSLLSSS